jgi:hypothetical protein
LGSEFVNKSVEDLDLLDSDDCGYRVVSILLVLIEVEYLINKLANRFLIYMEEE